MKKITSLISRYIPVTRVIPLLTCVIINSFAYWGGQLLSASKYHHYMGFAWEEKIPVVPWTVIIYFGCYIFWIFNYILSCKYDEKKAYMFVCTDIFAKIVCFFCFVFLPATIQRPEITDPSIWGRAMRWLYKMDQPSALFPSIHCLVSWICFIGVRKQKKINLRYKVFTCLFALAVCVSTLTTKQHVFVDVVAGIGLAEFSNWFVRTTKFWKPIARFFNYMNRRLFMND